MIKKTRLLWLSLSISLLWGSAFPISKIAIEQIGVWSFRFYCNLISVIFLIIVVAFFFRCRPKFSDVLLCIPLGVFNIFLVPLMNNIALNYTDAAKASVLIYTMPAFTSVIYVIINKKINIKYIIVSMLSFAGVLVFVLLDKIGTGETIILISAFFWAVGTFLSERININAGLISKVLYQNIVSLFFISITMPFVSANVYQPFSVLSKSDVIMPVLYMGIAGGVFVYILWFYIIENGGAVFTSYTILVSPVVSVLISWFFLDEIITLNMLIGMIFIICSVFIAFNYKH